MGNELDRLRAASFRETQKLDGCTFTVNGGATEYAGILASGSEMSNLVPGGFLTDYDKTLEYLPADIALTVGDKVTTGGKVYRVVSLNGDGAPIYSANLTGVDKGHGAAGHAYRG